MKEIEKVLKKLGYKKTRKDFFGNQMFEKGNTIFYIGKITFKKHKTETFKQVSDRMFTQSLASNPQTSR